MDLERLVVQLLLNDLLLILNYFALLIRFTEII